MKNRISVDPLNLTDESRQILSRFLWRVRHGQLLVKGKTYFVGLRRIAFTKNIVIRQKTPDAWCCDVIDENNCGSGKFGSVYKVLAVLKSHDSNNHQHLSVNIKDKRVYKFQNNAAVNESQLMHRCPHLRARELFSGIPSMISMRKFPGMLLNDALNGDRKIKSFTHAQRYRITLALLRALKKQIHDNMICHRDIKPDNIFYDPATGEVNIFDLGVSQLQYFNYDRRSRGNATYSSPEDFTSVRTQQPVTINEFRTFTAMESKATVKSDIYSIARVIGLVWRDSDPIFFVKNADHNKLMLRRIMKKWEPEFALFQNLKSVSENERHGIENQLRRMTSISPDDRPDLDECIQYFDKMYFDYKLTKLPVWSHEMMKNSHDLAVSALSNLDKIENHHDLSIRLAKVAQHLNLDRSMPLNELIRILKGKFNKDFRILAIEASNVRDARGDDGRMSLQEFNNDISEQTSLASLHMYLQSMISSLDDHPLAVAEFIETLGFNCLDGVKSRSDLSHKVDNIVNSFTNNMEQLLEIFEKSERTADRAVIEDLDRFFTEISSARINLDTINLVNIHMIKKIAKLSEGAQSVPRTDSVIFSI